MSNVFKTALLMAGLAILLMFIGGLVGGRQGVIVAFIFSLAMNFFSYWFSDKIVLSLYGAREVGPQEAPELYDIVRNLAIKAGLPMPRVYIIPSDTPNAFATGRNPDHAVVAATEGILRILNRQELEGVLGHELAHVKNRDILTSTIAATMASAIFFLADMARWGFMFGGFSRDDEDRGAGGAIASLLMIILAPIAAMLIQMAISRSREYGADEDGAMISGRPLALASALRNIETAVYRRPMLEASPTTAHLFIINPLKSLKGDGLFSLFSTHPPTEKRIERLEQIARQMGQIG
ncbi:MAG TPA: zinc metalloprotease HtpX [Candidatus Limnocylindrales bacterium]|nr:zinc metalloprotease HtpX [Candidatus Limnocylindrales bacterium]